MISEIRPFRKINRKKTKEISVGKIKVGGNNPITVQTMTNTLTTDHKSTIEQIHKVTEAGADIVRVSCPDSKSTEALKTIIKHVDVPIVADIHFHYKRAIEAAENGADCLRINPGNIGDTKRVAEVVSAAKNNNCSIRIGVNAGSLEKDILEKYKEPCPEALVDSALRNIKIIEDENFFNTIKNFVENKDYSAAKTLCQNTNNPISRMIEKGIDRIDKPMTDISAAIENQGKLEIYKMENNLSNLATISGAAPMIGFLGTVIGMILAFHQMASSGGNIDVEMLSQGIYTAMVTTVAGLIVGIIAYISYNFLVSKVEKVVFQLEARTTEFLDHLHHNE